MNRPQTILALEILSLVAVTLLIYARGAAGPFLYDDIAFVVDNPAAADFSLALQTFGSPAATSTRDFPKQVYRPLIPPLYALVHAIGGMRPFFFHWLNYLVHAGGAILLFLLLLKLTAARDASFAAAVWWAVHPAHVEAVQWISGLDDVLCPLLLLLTFLLFLSGRRLGAGLAYLAALLTKEVAVMAPPLLFVLAFREAAGDGRPRARAAALRTVFYFLAAGAYVLLRQSLIGLQQDSQYWGHSLAATLLTMSHSFLIYLRLIFFPLSLRINYLFDIVRGFSPLVLAAAVVLALLAIVMIACARRRFPVSFGIGWFFVFMFPASNVLPILALVGERFLYLPLAGVAMLIAAVGAGLKTRRRWFALAWCLLIFWLAVGSYQRVGVWLDEEVFWRDILRKEPEILGYRNSLGSYYARQGRFAEAEALFMEVLQKRPADFLAAENLALLYLDTGRPAQSLSMYRQLQAFRPNEPRYRQGLEKAEKALAAAAPQNAEP
ncbi:MAG: tetratricopeptide repeat protein [Myxococcales bacterium]|nr:tetratricopeptide repeat protein [Myxococcales bacterium]